MSIERRKEQDALIVTIRRPEAKNALDRAHAMELHDAIVEASDDHDVRAIVLTAVGDVFVAGGDINDLAALVDGEDGADAVLKWGQLRDAFTQCQVPIIAAVSGDCFGGGCELLLLCDLVVMEEHATLSFRHVAMGLTPAWGGISNLLDRVGAQGAAYGLLTGARIPTQRAVAMGLVLEGVRTGRSFDRCMELASLIATHDRRSVAQMRHALQTVRAEHRASAWEAEEASFRSCWGGPPHRAALAAFASRKRRDDPPPEE